MTIPAPIEVHLIARERQRSVNRGSTCMAEIEIVRQSGFTGEIRLEMTAGQARLPPGNPRRAYHDRPA